MIHSLFWKCCQVTYKALLLVRDFYKNFTVPQELLEAESGGQGIVFTCPNYFILLYLEFFAMGLSIYFSIFSRELERADVNDSLFSQDSSSESAIHFVPLSTLHAFPYTIAQEPLPGTPASGGTDESLISNRERTHYD